MGTTMLSFVPVSAQQMTDVGTPRDQTLVVDMLNARVGNPTNMNMYQQGVTINHGYHQLAGAQLYDIDTAKGVQIPDLASEMPIANCPSSDALAHICALISGEHCSSFV
jgi:peptide/nickel transport system substrate-binding protein